LVDVAAFRDIVRAALHAPVPELTRDRARAPSMSSTATSAPPAA